MVGVSSDAFDLISWEIKNFAISVVVKIKSYGVLIRLTTVYGSPYEEGTLLFQNSVNFFCFGMDLSSFTEISI
jgi:hypothetical protein